MTIKIDSRAISARFFWVFYLLIVGFPLLGHSATLSFPRAAMVGYPTQTAAIIGKSTAICAALANSYAMSSGSSSITGAYVPVTWRRAGLLREMYYKITSYIGPSKDTPWACRVYDNGDCATAGVCGAGTVYNSGLVVSLDGMSLNNGCITSDFLRGIPSGPPPNSFLSGRWYQKKGYPCRYLTCGDGVGGEPEMWAPMWTQRSVGCELVTALPLPANAQLLTHGVNQVAQWVYTDGTSGYNGGIPVPNSGGSETWPGQSSPTSGTEAQGIIDDYFSNGALNIDSSYNVDITTLGFSGVTDTGITPLAVSTTIINNTVISSTTVKVVIDSTSFSALLSTDTGGLDVVLNDKYNAGVSSITSAFSTLKDTYLHYMIPVDSTTCWDGCFDLRFNSSFFGGTTLGRIVCVSDFGADWFVEMIRQLLVWCCVMSALIIGMGGFEQ